MIDNKSMAKHTTVKHSVKILPPIKLLFTESYALLKKTLAPFLVFNIIVFLITVGAVIMMGAGLFLLGFGAIISGIFNDNLPTLGASAVVSVAIFIIVIAIISSLAQIGSTIILFEGKSNAKPLDIIKRSAKFIPPLLGAGILMFFIVMGGVFLFVIPGIIFSIFLTLSYYAVITENKGPVEALKRSFYLVSTNFSAFFLRILALWGFLILINVILGAILGSIADSAGNEGVIGLVNLVNMAIQILTSWFSIAYMVTLFKHLKTIHENGEKSIKLISILSVVGWIIGALFLYSVINLVGTLISEFNSDEFQEQLTPDEREELERLFQEIDSEFNIEDLDQYIDEADETGKMEVETQPAVDPTIPAETI